MLETDDMTLAASNACSEDTLLPQGIVRVSEEALASARLVPQDLAEHHGEPGEKVTIAAFDFDGTCISTSSPMRLVARLGTSGKLSFPKLFRIMCWALAYKWNVSNKDAYGVRRRVFSAFSGKPAVQVNDYLNRFYHEKVAPHYRVDADAQMRAHLEAGHVVLLVSATFEPIVAAAMVDHPIEFAIASRMEIDADGCYTGQVEGLPTEGPDKMVVLRQFADGYFGKGNWTLGWAYGDHYSDLDLLEAAEHPCAVTPDSKLEKLAEERGWDILDWA